jgi:hypothetical protein
LFSFCPFIFSGCQVSPRVKIAVHARPEFLTGSKKKQARARPMHLLGRIRLAFYIDMVDMYSQGLQEHLDSKPQNEGYKHKKENSKTKKES